MSLPDNGSVWPPKDLGPVARQYAEHDAWYVGDPGLLRAAYGRGRAVTMDRPAQYRGGVTGTVARLWWGRPLGDITKRQDQLHVPLASDMAEASANLLFSEPPTLKVDDQDTQARLDEMVEQGLWTTFAEAAELGAALGDAYLRVTWDETNPAAFLTAVDADGAYPRFRWGQLVAVTFWWAVQADDTTVWRHVEHHELDQAGIGVILHGLYKGDASHLGELQPLDSHPSTRGLQELVSTLSPGLAVVHVPNRTPRRVLRRDPVGRNLGRSDYEGIEPLFDALDETYSSWMRDVRLGKGRIVVPQHLIESQGRGKGAVFDLDQDAFVGVNTPPSNDGSMDLQVVQFAIRVQEHQDTCRDLIAQILRSAGYSAATFGESDSASMRTATEVVAEQNRSYMTRDRKIRLWKPRMVAVLEKLLAVDNAVKQNRVKVERPSVVFADAVQADPEALARTAQALRVAQAASTKTLVQMQHPEWDETAIDAEVDAILAETQMVVDLPPLPGDSVQPDETPVDDA